ncbi:MAG: tyrosine-type recombinase/integrase [Rhodoferax sp.]|nr:tyrosine-type recombinase/integrase [Rhodoferax sp.]
MVRLSVKNVQIVASEGMTCYLDRSKGDRQALGRVYKCPSLSRLCPVTAFSQWISLAKLDQGPVYRSMYRWGNIADQAMHPNSLIPLLRSMLSLAGVAAVDEYSSHSLRRGFAGWARSSGWDLKDLMEYVGWTDIKSAMRYLEEDNTFLQARFERGLEASPEQKNSTLPVVPPATSPAPLPIAPPTVLVLVTISQERYRPHQ